LNWCGKGKRASHQTAAGSDDDAATATNYFDESDLEAPTLKLAKKMRSHSPMSLQPPPSHTLKSGSAGKVPGRAPSSRGGSSAGPGSAKKSDGRQGVAAKSVRAADEFEDDEADAEDELGPEAEEKERVWPEFEKRMAPAAFAAMKRELTSMFKQALRAIPYSNEASFKRLDKGYDQVKDDGDVATYKYKETKSDFIQKFSELDNDVNGIKAWRARHRLHIKIPDGFALFITAEPQIVLLPERREVRGTGLTVQSLGMVQAKRPLPDLPLVRAALDNTEVK
jgi:hypothetical protein